MTEPNKTVTKSAIRFSTVWDVRLKSRRDSRFGNVAPFGHRLPVLIDCVPGMVAGRQETRFQSTSWTLVRTAASATDPDSRAALATLCQKYWQPVYLFVQRRGFDPEHAKDLTQEFFALLIEKNYLADSDPERGSFRAFLLTAVKHFLANEWDRMHALKRGGGQIPVSIDVVAAEEWISPSTVEHVTPEKLFERRWAMSVLEHAMSTLRTEFRDAGKEREFDQVSTLLNRDAESASYETLASLRWASPPARYGWPSTAFGGAIGVCCATRSHRRSPIPRTSSLNSVFCCPLSANKGERHGRCRAM
jgi:RNA polymerase sigma-70 factor (ECF subfamily)